MRIHSTPPEKPVNLLGASFLNAKQTSRLKFKAEMLEAGERDNVNYWRTFQDKWRFDEQLNRVPAVIVLLAMEHLNYKHPKPDKQNEFV